MVMVTYAENVDFFTAVDMVISDPRLKMVSRDTKLALYSKDGTVRGLTSFDPTYSRGYFLEAQSSFGFTSSGFDVCSIIDTFGFSKVLSELLSGSTKRYYRLSDPSVNIFGRNGPNGVMIVRADPVDGQKGRWKSISLSTEQLTANDWAEVEIISNNKSSATGRDIKNSQEEN